MHMFIVHSKKTKMAERCMCHFESSDAELKHDALIRQVCEVNYKVASQIALSYFGEGLH